MGWTSFAMPREGARSYLDAHVYGWANDNQHHIVIDSALVGGCEYYAAVERTDLVTGDRIVFAGVALVSVSTRDGGTLAYKDMSENMEPYYYHCPARILGKLTPTEHPSALAWRAGCRAAADRRRADAKCPALRPGQHVRFDEPIRFSDRAVLSEFIVRSNPQRARGVVFANPATGRLYAIPKAAARPHMTFQTAESGD